MIELFINKDKDQLLLSRKVIEDCGYEGAGILSLLIERWVEIGQPHSFSFKREEIESELLLSFHKQKHSLDKLKEKRYIDFYYGKGNQVFYQLKIDSLL